MTEHIKVPEENDDQINTTLRETLPDKINDVELGSKEQKGIVLSCSSPCPLLSSSPLPLSFLISHSIHHLQFILSLLITNTSNQDYFPHW